MIQLYNDDCFNVLKTIPDHSVQLAICDLPYAVTYCKWDRKIDLEPFWTEMRRIMIPDRSVVLMFGTQPFTSELVMSNRDWFKYSLIWHKNRPTGFQHCGQKILSEHEDISVFSSGVVVSPQRSTRQMTYNPQGLTDLAKPRVRPSVDRKKGFMGKNILYSTGAIQTKTNYPRSILKFDSVPRPVHTTQKPVDLLEYLIRTFSNEGDIVIDPTCGSGSTGVAAVQTKRGFIGIERDPEYYEITSQRVSSATPAA
jgi:site-specific DNA-methyltransferase (adenine-specific)